MEKKSIGLMDIEVCGLPSDSFIEGDSHVYVANMGRMDTYLGKVINWIATQVTVVEWGEWL